MIVPPPQKIPVPGIGEQFSKAAVAVGGIVLLVSVSAGIHLYTLKNPETPRQDPIVRCHPICG